MSNNEKIKIIFDRIVETELIYENCPSDLKLEEGFDCGNFYNTSKCAECWKRVLNEIIQKIPKTKVTTLWCTHYDCYVDDIKRCGMHPNVFKSDNCEDCHCADVREVDE